MPLNKVEGIMFCTITITRSFLIGFRILSLLKNKASPPYSKTYILLITTTRSVTTNATMQSRQKKRLLSLTLRDKIRLSLLSTL